MQIYYFIQYKLDSNGYYTILNYTATYLTSNISLNTPFFIKSSVNYVVQYIPNQTIKSYSGNPGYIEGYPVIFQVAGAQNYFPLDISNSNGFCFNQSDFANTSLSSKVVNFVQSNIDYCK